MESGQPSTLVGGSGPRNAISVGATGTVLGVACALVGFDRIGAALTTSALIALLWGLHRFGRQGPDRHHSTRPEASAKG